MRARLDRAPGNNGEGARTPPTTGNAGGVSCNDPAHQNIAEPSVRVEDALLELKKLVAGIDVLNGDVERRRLQLAQGCEAAQRTINQCVDEMKRSLSEQVASLEAQTKAATEEIKSAVDKVSDSHTSLPFLLLITRLLLRSCSSSSWVCASPKAPTSARVRPSPR